MAATENLPIRQVAGTITTDETGKAVSVRPVRFVDGDVATDEAGRLVPTIPYAEVAGLTTTNSAGKRVSVLPVRVVAGASAVDEMGRPVSVLALKQQGLPPYAFPASAMDIGMGLSGVNSLNGYWPFANILWNALDWEPKSGSGDWQQAWGEVHGIPDDAAIASNTFSAIICEPAYYSLPQGVYTVLNPDGCEIGIGSGGFPNLVNYTTATEFTFTYNNNQLLALWARGKVTGKIRIIMPGLKAAWLAGEVWNPDYLTFLDGLNLKSLRFMDWSQSYKDLAEEWSDVPVAASLTDLPISFVAPSNALQPTVPPQLRIDLCNRLGVNPWLNSAARWSDDYMEQFATLLAAELDPSLSVLAEGPNETWNGAGPFNDSRIWIELYDFTRYEAVKNSAIGGWTRVAHGLSTGDVIAQFFTRENFTKQLYRAQYFPYGYGFPVYVEKVDNDNFKLYIDAARTTLVQNDNADATASYARMSRLIYKKRVEAGKVASVDTNHAIRSMKFWEKLASKLGSSRVKRIMGSQFVNPSVTSARLAVTGAAAATDAVAFAPYYNGDWFVGAVDISSGQLAPKAWSKNAGDPDGTGNSVSVRIAVYAAGSTPRKDQVIAGTGAGYIVHRDIPITIGDRAVYTTGSAITGLSNGTSYEVFTLFSGVYGDKWMAHATVTVSATTSTVTMTDSFADWAKRVRRRSTSRLPASFPGQIAVAGGKALTCYEAGPDYFAAAGNTPAEVQTARTNFWHSDEAAETLPWFYKYLASFGVKVANQFSDVNAIGPGVFSIVDDLRDTDDPRYEAFAALNGQIAQVTTTSVSSATAPNVNVEPSYPAVVYTFPDASLTYEIYSGDDAGNFQMVGNELRIVNGAGINWGTPAGRNIVIEARGAVGAAYPTISFATGFAWYEADAKFAWNSLTDTDNAQIDPTVGSNPLTRLLGSGASISGGLWDMGGTNLYGATQALTSALDISKPILLAAALDKDNMTSGNVMMLGFSAFTATFQIISSVFQATVFSSSNTSAAFAATTPSGLHVYWLYLSPDVAAGFPGGNQFRVGIDQVENVAAATTKALSATATRRLYVGGLDSSAGSDMKHGSVQVVNRAGMTLADALAIVAKMQTLHGIS